MEEFFKTIENESIKRYLLFNLSESERLKKIAEEEMFKMDQTDVETYLFSTDLVEDVYDILTSDEENLVYTYVESDKNLALTETLRDILPLLGLRASTYLGVDDKKRNVIVLRIEK